MVAAGTSWTSGTSGTRGTRGRAVVPARPSSVAARPSDREHVPSHSFGLSWSWRQKRDRNFGALRDAEVKNVCDTNELLCDSRREVHHPLFKAAQPCFHYPEVHFNPHFLQWIPVYIL